MTMCVGKGMIIRRGQRWPDYLDDSNDHAPLLEKFKLTDTKLIDRDFVRIECLPLGSLTSCELQDWQVSVDEEGTLPAWYREYQPDWRYKCLKVLAEKIIPAWLKYGVGGDLYLRGTAVKSLRQLKSVGGDLYLQGTAVKSLPDDVIVKGKIYK